MDYQITCVDRAETDPGHVHIVALGTVAESGRTLPWIVAEVLFRMNRGDRFYAVAGEDREFVHPFTCECSFRTIRAAPHNSAADDLDRLPACRDVT